MPITSGRTSGGAGFQTPSTTDFETAFKSPDNGSPPTAITVYADTQPVIIRVYPNFLGPSGTIGEFTLPAGASEEFFATKAGGITQLDVKGAQAGAKVGWAVTGQ